MVRWEGGKKLTDEVTPDAARAAEEPIHFTFLGFTFRSRTARTRNGGTFVSFQPAIRQEALKKTGTEVRSWRLHHRTGSTFAQLASPINPVVTGWMQYYGAFYLSALNPLLTRINSYLVRWIRCKYRRLKPVKKARRATKARSGHTLPCSGTGSGHRMPGEQDDKSRVTGDCYARICGAQG
ncbi:group II intron maturase-specific domain-containing protein [Nocardia gamkensis]|uniref:group II intron maturase-specific domain-containing protein n=1 Tax=Nocardia gamkensis TaxID=352869 RepID=UPI0036EE109B